MAQAQSGQTHIHQNPFATLYLPMIQQMSLSLQVVPNRVQDHPIQSAAAVTFVLLPALAWVTRRRFMS